jgi:hypothetical protein
MPADGGDLVMDLTDPHDSGSAPVAASFDYAAQVPMGFGDLVDRIYRLMRSHLRLFFGIASVPAATIFVVIAAMFSFTLPTILAQGAGNSATVGVFAGGAPKWFPALMLVTYPIIIAVYALYMPAASFAATQADRGVKVSFKQAYGVAWGRFGRSLWLMILMVLCIMIPIVVIGVLLVGGVVWVTGVKAGPASAFFLVPLLVMLYLGILVYSILIMIRLSVAFPAAVEEGLSAWGSIVRSVKLTQNAMGRIFLVMLVVYAITYAAILVFILVFLFLAALVALAAVATHVTRGSTAFFVLAGLGVFGYSVVLTGATVLSYSAMTTATAVIYHDQRRRLDGPSAIQPMS